MKIKDDRIYAFIVAHTANSRAHVRRITVPKDWVNPILGAALVLLCAALYGFYGLTQQARHGRIARENARLRAEKEEQRKQLNSLKLRVERIESASRRLAEMAGVETSAQDVERKGAGGPALPLSNVTTARQLKRFTDYVERELIAYEVALRKRATMPSIQPVEGEKTDGFGTRTNPFNGYSSEFHSGQDIAAPSGTPVVAAGGGRVSYAGWQSGYGRLVIVDHGNGLATRYGHLSKIVVKTGQTIRRGDRLGHVGSTGRSTGPHLHYEVRKNDAPIDPQRYLQQR